MLYCWSHFLADSFSIALLFSNYLHTSIMILHFCPSSIEILYLQYFSPQLKHSAGTVTVWEEVEVSRLLTVLLRLDVEPDTLLRNDALILPFCWEELFIIPFRFLFQQTLPLFTSPSLSTVRSPSTWAGAWCSYTCPHLPLSHELREGRGEQPSRHIPLGQHHHSVQVYLRININKY